MSKLIIKHSHNTYDCEDCGLSFSDGAVVTLDGETIIDAPACAHCFGNTNIDYVHILVALCKKLDIEIVESGKDIDIAYYGQELETFNKLT